MILQLDPPLPVVTPKGSGVAHILIDYGAEFNLMWTVFIDATGECWTFSNQQIRACKNVTLGRTAVLAFKEPASDTVSTRQAAKSNGATRVGSNGAARVVEP